MAKKAAPPIPPMKPKLSPQGKKAKNKAKSKNPFATAPKGKSPSVVPSFPMAGGMM